MLRVPIVDESPGRRLHAATRRHVAERRRASRSLRGSEARLRMALDAAGAGMWRWDARTNVAEWDDRHRAIYGFEPELAPSFEAWRDRIHPQDLARVMARLERMLATPGDDEWNQEFRACRCDGRVVWIQELGRAQRGADGQVLSVTGIDIDVTERKRLEEDLAESHADLERLIAAQHTVEDAERRRFARELHDELQQVLAAIRMEVGAIELELGAQAQRVQPLLARVEALAGTAIASARRIVNDLRPLLLEELGLLPALEVLASRFGERTGIAATMDGNQDGDTGNVPEAIAICFYRVAQEALNNVARHSRARKVRLTLAATPDGAWMLRVADDGQGLSAEDRRKPTSFGLRGMAERVRALGGTLRVISEPGGGVTIEVRTRAADAPAPQAADVAPARAASEGKPEARSGARRGAGRTSRRGAA